MDNTPDIDKAFRHYQWATDFERAGQYKSALREAKIALANCPDDQKKHYDKGAHELRILLEAKIAWLEGK